MSVCRITNFSTSDMGKATEMAESMRDEIATAGANSILIVATGDNTGVVIAHYATQALMDTATAVNKSVFGKMIAAGVIDGASISPSSGEVIFSS